MKFPLYQALYLATQESEEGKRTREGLGEERNKEKSAIIPEWSMILVFKCLQ